MVKPSILPVVLVAALLAPVSAFAADNDDIAELRRMLESMKQQYEQRISVLENRIRNAENQARMTREETVNPSVTPSGAYTNSSSRNGRAFNPAISLVLQGSAASYSKDPEDWALPGFQLGGEAGLRAEGLSATETEVTASANVDDAFFAQTTLGLHEEDGSTEMDVEEAFVDVMQLPAGMGLRLGRFFPETGYLNTRHTHAWDFADAPLTSQAFLGHQ